MSGTPEKILEHFLETIRLEPALNEATGKHREQLGFTITFIQKKCQQQPTLIPVLCHQSSLRRKTFVLTLEAYVGAGDLGVKVGWELPYLQPTPFRYLAPNMVP